MGVTATVLGNDLKKSVEGRQYWILYMLCLAHMLELRMLQSGILFVTQYCINVHERCD